MLSCLRCSDMVGVGGLAAGAQFAQALLCLTHRMQLKSTEVKKHPTPLKIKEAAYSEVLSIPEENIFS